MCNLTSGLKDLASLDLSLCEESDLLKALGRAFTGNLMQTWRMRAGLVWRARITAWEEKLANVSELWYPPTSLVRNYGRANLPGDPVFYCATHPGAAILETKAAPKSIYTLLACRIEKPAETLNLIPMGLGFLHKHDQGVDSPPRRPDPEFFLAREGYSNEEALELQSFLRKQFTRHVPQGQEHQYRITANLSNLLLSKGPTGEKIIDGIAYSPVSAPFGANLALSRQSVDRRLVPDSVFIVFAARDGIMVIDEAHKFETDGRISWQCRTELRPFFSPQKNRP